VRVFLQAQDEGIVINGDITVTILKIEGDEVVLEIDAPEWMAIDETPQALPQREGCIVSLPAR
jgi:carbon storage regulator CsrA